MNFKYCKKRKKKNQHGNHNKKSDRFAMLCMCGEEVTEWKTRPFFYVNSNSNFVKCHNANVMSVNVLEGIDYNESKTFVIQKTALAFLTVLIAFGKEPKST